MSIDSDIRPAYVAGLIYIRIVFVAFATYTFLFDNQIRVCTARRIYFLLEYPGDMEL